MSTCFCSICHELFSAHTVPDMFTYLVSSCSRKTLSFFFFYSRTAPLERCKQLLALLLSERKTVTPLYSTEFSLQDTGTRATILRKIENCILHCAIGKLYSEVPLQLLVTSLRNIRIPFLIKTFQIGLYLCNVKVLKSFVADQFMKQWEEVDETIRSKPKKKIENYFDEFVKGCIFLIGIYYPNSSPTCYQNSAAEKRL